MEVIKNGNLLDAKVEALVNTVNTVGVMGKGVALQFKKAFPANFRAYEAACRRNEVKIGEMLVTPTGAFEPRLIINFPTKQHWRGDSSLETIRLGLADLIRVVREHSIQSLALPPLGCGLGGLKWEEVGPLIERAFAEVPDVQVLVYAPGAVPAAARPVARTARPPMTAWKAALIQSVAAYGVLGFEATHHEAQKLLYLLVAAGAPLEHNFVEGQFGPYDDGMRHGLMAMDGHYVQGFGEGRRLEAIRLLPGAVEESEEFLNGEPAGSQVNQAIQRVSALIEGFESPYGLELLSTAHWVVQHNGARGVQETVNMVHAWNDRKAKTLNADDVRIAYERLNEQGWLSVEGRA